MLSRRLYYRLKPYLPWSLRMGVRRLVAGVQRRRFAQTWPINELAGRLPADWPGWPDGKKFALVFTHDVEGAVGLAKCRQLMQLEQRLGFCSSFNFIPEGDYHVSPARSWRKTDLKLACMISATMGNFTGGARNFRKMPAASMVISRSGTPAVSAPASCCMTANA